MQNEPGDCAIMKISRRQREKGIKCDETLTGTNNIVNCKYLKLNGERLLFVFGINPEEGFPCNPCNL